MFSHITTLFLNSYSSTIPCLGNGHIQQYFILNTVMAPPKSPKSIQKNRHIYLINTTTTNPQNPWIPKKKQLTLL